MLNTRNIPDFFAHEIRHAQENGRELELIFGPYEALRDLSYEDFLKEKQRSWSKTINSVGWERVWAVWDTKNIRGHLTLKHQPRLPTNLHRATLEMGLESGWRNKGLGTQLIQEALAWAEDQPTLTWVDLRVFEHNTAALQLYRKIGFRETGRTEDYCRVFGKSINDVSMSFALRRNQSVSRIE